MNELERLFDAVLDVPRAERARWIEQHCPNDEALRTRLRQLLAADDTNRDAALDAPLLSRSSEQMPLRVGAFRPTRLLGEGGMGLVFEATQDGTARLVALKLVRAGLASPTGFQRFTQEAHLLARLNHPGVAQVYDAGSAEAQYPGGARARRLFLAMERVAGANILDYAQQQRLSVPRRVELIEQVAHAVQHAHQRRVLHRDLKPSNILVDAAGQTKIVDFGIGRLLASTGSVAPTVTGQILGTAQYMSPEQAAGHVSRVDTRTDVYALGMILYELLTGEPAFDLSGLSPIAAARRIADESPPRLASRAPAIRGDLDAIVHKAIARDPEARYESAGALASDLRRCLQHEPIEARRPTALDAVWHFVRRHRALVGGLAATMLALSVGIVGMTIFALRADRARRAASSESYRLAIEAASSSIELGDFDRARQALDAAPLEYRGWEHAHLLSRLKHWLLAFDRSTTARGCPCVAPNGRVLSALADGRIGVWDLRDGRRLDTLDLGAPVSTLARTAPLGQAVAALRTGGALLFDTQTGRVIETLGGLERPVFLDVQIDGEARLVCGWNESEVIVLRAGESEPVLRLDSSEYVGGLRGVSMSAEGTRLAALGPLGIQVVDLPSGRVAASAPGGGLSICLTTNGDILVGGRQRTVRVLTDALQEKTVLTGHRLRDIADVVSLPGRRAASVDGPGNDEERAQGTLRVWDLTAGREIGALAMPPDAGRVRLAGLPDGRLVTGGAEGTPMLLWSPDAHDATLLGRHESYAYGVAWSPDGRSLASFPFAGRDVYVRVWDTRTRREVARLATKGGEPGHLAYSADGATLFVSAGLRQKVPIEAWATDGWRRVADDVAETQVIADCGAASLRLHRSDCFSPDGTTRVRIESVDGRERVVVLREGRRIVTEWDRTSSFAFSPDGVLLAIAQDSDTDISLLAARTLAPRRTVPVGLRPRALAFSPDGTRLAVVGFANVVRMFDTRTWEPVVDLRGHTATIHDVQFSPDGRSLATASSDRTVRVWTSFTQRLSDE